MSPIGRIVQFIAEMHYNVTRIDGYTMLRTQYNVLNVFRRF